MKEQWKTDLKVVAGVIALILLPIIGWVFSWLLLAFFALGALALLGLGAFIYLERAWARSKARRSQVTGQ